MNTQNVFVVRKKKLSKSRKDRLRAAGATEENLKLIAQDYAYTPLNFDDICVTWLQKGLIKENLAEAPKVPWKLVTTPVRALDIPGVSDDELLGMFSAFSTYTEQAGAVDCSGLSAHDLKDVLSATRRMSEFVSKVVPVRFAVPVVCDMIQSLVNSRKVKKAVPEPVMEGNVVPPGFLKFGQFPAFKYSVEVPETSESLEDLINEFEQLQDQPTAHSRTLLSDTTSWEAPCWVSDDDELQQLRLGLHTIQSIQSTSSEQDGTWVPIEPVEQPIPSVLDVNYWPITVETSGNIGDWLPQQFKWLAAGRFANSF